MFARPAAPPEAEIGTGTFPASPTAALLVARAVALDQHADRPAPARLLDQVGHALRPDRDRRPAVGAGQFGPGAAAAACSGSVFRIATTVRSGTQDAMAIAAGTPSAPAAGASQASGNAVRKPFFTAQPSALSQVFPAAARAR